MAQAVQELDFETAAILRDEIAVLTGGESKAAKKHLARLKRSHHQLSKLSVYFMVLCFDTYAP